MPDFRVDPDGRLDKVTTRLVVIKIQIRDWWSSCQMGDFTIFGSVVQVIMAANSAWVNNDLSTRI